MAKLAIFIVWQMCTATRGCTNLKLVPMLFAPYLGTSINTTFQNSKILFFHRTLVTILLSVLEVRGSITRPIKSDTALPAAHPVVMFIWSSKLSRRDPSKIASIIEIWF